MAEIMTPSKMFEKFKSDASSVMYNVLNTSLDVLGAPLKIMDDIVQSVLPAAPTIKSVNVPTPFGYEVPLPVVAFEQPSAPKQTVPSGPAVSQPVQKTQAAPKKVEEEEFVFALGR